MRVCGSTVMRRKFLNQGGSAETKRAENEHSEEQTKAPLAMFCVSNSCCKGGEKKKNVRTKEVAASGTLSASNHLHLGDILCCLWVLLIVPLGEFLFHEFMQCSFEFMEMLSSLW